MMLADEPCIERARQAADVEGRRVDRPRSEERSGSRLLDGRAEHALGVECLLASPLCWLTQLEITRVHHDAEEQQRTPSIKLVRRCSGYVRQERRKEVSERVWWRRVGWR